MEDERTRAAAEALEELGLTEYEAKCFVALDRVGQGTAKDVSKLSGVPRSRVYDTVDRLHERGYVDVQQSDPREYRAVPREQVFEKLRRRYDEAIDAAGEALDGVEAAETSQESGAWAITGGDHVADRVADLVDDASERVHVLVADESTVDDRSLDRLAAAGDRGAEIVVGVPTASVRDRIEEAVPEARVVTSPDLERTAEVEGKRPGKTVMVDRHAVLTSAVERGDLPGIDRETALWSPGRDHGYAVWMCELLRDRLEE